MLFVETADLLARMARETLVHARYIPSENLIAYCHCYLQGQLKKLYLDEKFVLA
jgi:hypothetical protein